MLDRAAEFRRLLESGQVRNRAELARRFGLSRARVTQVMKLTNLPPAVAERLRRGEGPGSERALRPVLRSLL